ncbi:MAG TPA: hypothetical protein VGN81_10890 [Pseudonocardiaceae bacterium]|jgi:hypothetical protein
MNGNQRVRATLRDQARHRVRSATRWVAVVSGALAAAFAVVLAHNAAVAAPGSTGTTTGSPQGQTTQGQTTQGQTTQGTGANSGPALQPPTQPPSIQFGDGYSNYGSSGGS